MNKGLYRQARKPAEAMKRQEIIEGFTIDSTPVEQPLIVDKTTECHVTPPDVAARMVDYLGPTPNMLTLDPQCGSGNLLQALLDSGHYQYEITAIERNVALWGFMQQRFSDSGRIAGFNRCFLEYAEEAKGKIEFPAIVCNPPFSKIKKHMDAAISLMGYGGHESSTLVALVPITYQHADAEEMEVLPVGIFLTAPSIATKIIRIRK